MGRPPAKSVGGPPRESGKGSGVPWLDATRDRLADHGGKIIGIGKGQVPEQTQRLVAERARTISGGSSGSAGVFAPPEGAEQDANQSQPRSVASASSVWQASLEAHRHGSGVRASGFEPQRHAFYILGRPVQVCMNSQAQISFYSWG